MRRIDRLCLAAAGLGLSVSLCGCALFPEEKEIDATLRVAHYSPAEHTTSKVARGDLDDTSTVTALYEYTQQKDYYLQYAGSEDDWGREIRNYVVRGDLVKKGQLLAEAPCDSLNEQLLEYETQEKEQKATIAYQKKRLSNAGSEEKSSIQQELKDSQAALAVTKKRIAETNAKIADYRIYADMDGQVIWVADVTMTGSYSSGDRYVTLASLEGVFRGTMETDACTLQVGDVLNAQTDQGNISVTVAEIADGEEDGTQTVAFQTDQTYTSGTKIHVEIGGEKRSNVLYLPQTAVTVAEDGCYVLQLDENGLPYAKQIAVSGPVDGCYVVESGLEEGDEVVDE